MKVTKENYAQSTANLDWAKMPQGLQESHDLWPFDSNDPTEKEIETLYLEKLNAWIEKNQEPKKSEKKAKKQEKSEKKSANKFADPEKKPKGEANEEERRKKLDSIRERIKGHLVMHESEVVSLAKEIHELRQPGIKEWDEGQTAKKVLYPSFENLIRWAKAPSKYDLAGVDSNGSDPNTGKPQFNSGTNRTWWDRFWNGKNLEKQTKS
jgi:hypothetical protein